MFDEENKKFFEILNSFSQINSYKIHFGDFVVFDKIKENYYLIDKKEKNYKSFKYFDQINYSNTVELIYDFHDLFVYDNVFYLADKSKTIKVVKDGKIIKDLLIDLEIVKIHLTSQNNILIILRDNKDLFIKIYDLNLEYVNSEKFDIKSNFSSLLILDDIVYFLSKQSSNQNWDYYSNSHFSYYSIVGIIGCLSENHLENLYYLIPYVQWNLNDSDHFLCYEDKLIYVSNSRIYENKIAKRSFM